MKFRRVLAMTFTNKAANEMKERILLKLIQLSKSPQNRTNDDIKEIKNTANNLNLSESILVENAKRSLNAILHNYGVFSVMTIDKFTHKVIRTFAKDLDLSLDFEVELDLDSLQKNVADLLFDQIGRDAEISKLMTDYAESNLEEDKSWNFKESLIKFSNQLFKEDALEAIKELDKLNAEDFLAVKTELISFNKKFENSLVRMGNEAMDLIRSKGLELGDFHGGGSTGAMKFFSGIESGIKKKEASPSLFKHIESDKWAGAKSLNKGAVEEIAPLLTQYFWQINDLIQSQTAQYILNLQILKIINNLSLMKYLLNITEEIKEKDNVLLISDFYKKIAKIITEEPVPFIYERLGVRYDHFLLDEFQDTSRLQWVNLIPLLHNSLSSKKMNLIVGDGKQAIYRWRNGEVEQFVKLPDEIDNPENIPALAEAELKFKDEGDPISLKNNYRSSPDIVHFNNHFFEYLISSQDEYIKRIYADVHQNAIKEFGGYLEFNLLEEKDDEAQLNYVLEVVKRSKQKGFELNDICILVRRNIEGSRLAVHLTDNDIEVISQDSLHVSKDKTVKFIFNVIAALASPHSMNFTKKCLEHYEEVIDKDGTEEIILSLLQEKKINLKKWFENKGYLLKSPEYFHSFYEFTEHLVEIFDLDFSNNVYLQFFLEQVHQYEKKHSTDIQGFIEWFENKGAKESIKSPEGANAVNIMSIHKSKGLQFPIVVCAFFDWDISKNDSPKWILDDEHELPAYFLKPTNDAKTTKHKHLLEQEELKLKLDHLNMVYVAFTRPEVALFVVGNAKSHKPSPAKAWIQPYLASTETSFVKEKYYHTGSFEQKIDSAASKTNIYQVEFFKQHMNKPTLSVKNAEQWDIHDLDQKRLYGSQLHLLLSKLSSREGLGVQLDKLIRKGTIDAQFRNDLLADGQRLFNDERFQFYFANDHVKNEQVLIDEEGTKHIPDKIIYHNDQTIVVDFKTGKEHQKRHSKQLERYISLLEKIGETNVSGEVFYTEDCQVTQV
jgi:ATP-dependent exoDNAse (exonuclease V) beta subunit